MDHVPTHRAKARSSRDQHRLPGRECANHDQPAPGGAVGHPRGCCFGEAHMVGDRHQRTRRGKRYLAIKRILCGSVRRDQGDAIAYGEAGGVGTECLDDACCLEAGAARQRRVYRRAAGTQHYLGAIKADGVNPKAQLAGARLAGHDVFDAEASASPNSWMRTEWVIGPAFTRADWRRRRSSLVPSPSSAGFPLSFRGCPRSGKDLGQPHLLCIRHMNGLRRVVGVGSIRRTASLHGVGTRRPNGRRPLARRHGSLNP